MRYLSVAWTLISKFVELYVAILIIGISNNSFENIVFILLIMIYLLTSFFSSLYSRLTLELDLKHDKQFIHLSKLLNDTQVSSFEESLQEKTDNLKKGEIKFWINTVGMVVIDLILTINLLQLLF